MTITKGRGAWRGSSAGDLKEYLHAYAAGGAPVGEVVFAVCTACGAADGGFGVAVDDEQGAAVRACAVCGVQAAMLDSADHLDDADLGEAACPCGHEEFDVAVGFALREDGEVAWVSLGLRCRNDGVLGVYADWKIDYSPSRQLLASV